MTLIGLLTATSAAALPLEYTHQGRVTDADGTPINGTLDVTLRLVEEPSGNTLTTEIHPNVELSDGYYAVSLGSIATLNPAWFDGRDLSLGVTIEGGSELTPRTAILPVPYAYRAETSAAADVLDGRADGLDTRADGLDTRADGLDTRADVLEARIDVLDAHDGNGLLHLGPGVHSNVDVAGISTVQLEPGTGLIEIMGLAGGVPGQVVRFIQVNGGGRALLHFNEAGASQPFFTAQAYDQELNHYEGATYVYKDTGLWFPADSNIHGEWHSFSVPSGWTSSGAKCRRSGDWIEFRGRINHTDLASGWPAATLTLPAGCVPATSRYTETPCHATSSVRNRVCNVDYRSNGELGIYSDFNIVQIRFEGVRIWGGAE